MDKTLVSLTAKPNTNASDLAEPSFTSSFQLMDTTGLEPVTPTMSTWCSNQLSYASELA